MLIVVEEEEGGDFLGRCVSVCVCVSAANRVPISTVKRPYLAGRSGPGLRLSVRRFAVIFIEPAHTHTQTHTRTHARRAERPRHRPPPAAPPPGHQPISNRLDLAISQWMGTPIEERRMAGM